MYACVKRNHAAHPHSAPHLGQLHREVTCFLQELQFVQQLEPRMKAGAGKLQELLSEGLAQALKEGNAPAQIHCLQAFAAIGDASGAEQVLLI